MAMKNSFNKGFTLINLMLAVSIISILIALAATTITNGLPAYRLSAAARHVMTALMAARMEAVSKNANVTVSFSGTSYTVNNKVIHLSNDYKDITATASGGLTFFPTGMASSSVTVTLVGEAGLPPKFIDIAPGGRARIR